MKSKDRIALISVSDKGGICDFARELHRKRWKIISTGGTAALLADDGLPVKKVSEVTDFPEILGGRVKTLHPRIHGGILARREQQEHCREIEMHNIDYIDMVVVNLYPFVQTISREGVTLEEAIENIDIGGPTMVRAAAKNYRDVIVVVNPERYRDVLMDLDRYGDASPELRFALSVEAFSHTAEYDSFISGYLSRCEGKKGFFPHRQTMPFLKKQDLRYGENPQQKAAFYIDAGGAARGNTIASARQWQGKELSFNNINDLDAAWGLVQEFEDIAVVAVKHANPCGVGGGEDVAEAYRRAHDADPVSIFGGIVAVNREVDEDAARMMAEIFLEVVVAPSFTPEALEVFKQNPGVRLLTIPPGNFIQHGPIMDYKKVSGGLLVQEKDTAAIESRDWKTVTGSVPTSGEREALVFNLKVAKHVKSNAIVIGTGKQTLGIGAGQMSRIGAARIALEQAGKKAAGAVMASDAFFPFPDTVEEAAKAGIKAIVQPGGSLKDRESIEACNKHGIAMVFTGRRYFKH